MKTTILCLSILCSIHDLMGQSSDTIEKKPTNDDTKVFRYFEIPAVINGSNIDPSGISSISANFTESEITFKLGIPGFFKPDSTNNQKIAGYLKFKASADDGVSTIWKSDEKSAGYGGGGGLSFIINHRYWYAGDKTKHTSEAVNWLNFTTDFKYNEYNVFSPTASFGNIRTRLYEPTGSVYLTFNRYFFSNYTKCLRFWSCIWSVGGGYSKTNNFDYLSSRTFESTRLVYNSDSSSFQTVTQTKSGKEGTFVSYAGATIFGEIYFPIIRDVNYLSVYLGNKLSFFAIDNNEKIVNASTGFYVNVKEKKTREEKIASGKTSKDVINLSIVLQFNRLNRVNVNDGYEKNASLSLQAAVPLRFN